jgi:signal transduction histidine kinase
LQDKHEQEKEQLEKKNLKLMALFAELDPDPVLRADLNGNIIFFNTYAKELFSDKSPMGKHLSYLIPDIDFDTLSTNRHEIKKPIELNKKHYSVIINSLPSLDFFHIYFHNITDIVKSELKLKEYQSKLRKLSMYLEDKLEDERNHIARELHDSIGQNLSLLKMKTQNIASNASADEINNMLSTLSAELSSAIKEVKDIAYQLKPKILDELGLEPAIRSLIAQVNENTNINGTIALIGNKRRIDSTIETSLYRVTQEATSNILAHSEAKEFKIQLIYLANTTRLVISDDGKGFIVDELQHKANSGIGLINMRERIENLGGSLKIESTPNNGTILFVEVAE